MSRISDTSVVVAIRDQESSGLDGETVVLHHGSGIYYGLDPVGSYIWGLIQRRRVVGEIRDVVAGRYDVAPTRCERDLLDLLGRLWDEGLIEIRASWAGAPRGPGGPGPARRGGSE
jgi:hypothetical protein